jgi:hypothetical protein
VDHGDGLATRSSRGHRTICLPIAEGAYLQAVHDHAAFRRWIDDRFRVAPELFPANFAQGYEPKDGHRSVERGAPIRRFLLKDKTAYSVRPSFLMPNMTARRGRRRSPVPAQEARPLVAGVRLSRRSSRYSPFSRHQFLSNADLRVCYAGR